MTMYCPGHGETLPCSTCADNLARRIEREAAAEPTKEWGKAGAIPLVPENTEGAIFENAIRRMGVHAACEWFGYPAHHEFTVDTIAVLRERSEQAQAATGGAA
ncbi:MAG: hypothetical protein J0H69_17100 [Burkholderiales bacterium]|nr:hypothetical protein [Burkholderiales bacterium]